MSSSAHAIKEQVRQATNIVDLIGSDLQLRRQGNLYVGLCPWHQDSRPSLQVNPDRQTWKCWVCDVGGDIFNYVMKRDGAGFREALDLLADRAGIDLAPAGFKRTQPGQPDDRATLLGAMKWATNQFHQCLLESSDAAGAREYLQTRHVNQDSIQRYQLGFAPNQPNWLLDRARNTEYSPAVMQAVGLVAQNDRGWKYDRFRGRVLFPISDAQGRPIAVGGRVLPELATEKTAKYINSPETRLFTKSRQLYGLDVVRRQIMHREHALIMEGYTDVVIARQFGVDNVVAVLGTALGLEHVDLLKRYATKVTLVLDGDEAGQRRTNQVLELFVASQMELRIVTLPAGLDPCDFIIEKGVEAFDEMVGAAPDALDHLVASQTSNVDTLRDTHQANQALERVLGVLSKAPQQSLDSRQGLHLRQQQLLGRLARLFHVDEANLRLRLAEMRKSPRPGSVPTRTSEQPAASAASTLSSWDRELFILLLRTPEAVSAVIEKIADDDLATPAARQLLAIYRRLDLDGVLPELHRVLDGTEDASLQHIVVELDEQAVRIDSGDDDLKLREIIDAYHQRRENRQRQQEMDRLDSQQLNETEELEILARLIKSKQLEE